MKKTTKFVSLLELDRAAVHASPILWIIVGNVANNLSLVLFQNCTLQTRDRKEKFISEES